MIDWIKDNLFEIGTVAVVALLFAALVVAILISLPQLDEGLVVDKDYEPPRTRYYTTVTNGRPVGHTQYDDADWRIMVQGVTKDGKHRTEWWDVGAGMYELIEIGDYVFKECGAIRIEKED